MSLSGAEGSPLDWRKARRSIANGDCVEVAPTNGQIACRDSKDPGGPILSYSSDAFRAFLIAVKEDGFYH
jgi:Domain of unknown function (DUF397)